MKSDRILIASVLFLAAGIGWTISHWTGNVGFSAAYPIAGTSLKIAVSCGGLAALCGVTLTIAGLLLLIWSFVLALLNQAK